MPRPRLVPVLPQQIQCGLPVPFPVFDAGGTLLLGEGQQVETRSQLDSLLEIGLYRPEEWISPGARPGPEMPTSSFAGLQLQPGTAVYLRESAAKVSRPYHAVRLIGWLDGEDVLVTATASDGRVMVLQPGTQVEARLLSGKELVLFKSVLRLGCDQPYPYLHLAYPQQVLLRQLRKGLRTTIEVPVRVASHENAAVQDGTIVNLSAGGCLLEMPVLLAGGGDTLVLEFELPAAAGTCSLRGVVRNLNTRPAAFPVVQYGIEFIDASPQARKQIEYFVLHGPFAQWYRSGLPQSAAITDISTR